MLRECLFLVTVCVFGAGSWSGRGFFCRDPETGKLHAANTTWPATSFCGSYHCKIKRKNITSTVYVPLRQINITAIKVLGDKLKIKDIEKDNKEKVRETEPHIKDGMLNLVEHKIDDKNVTDQDRYLSDKEIKSLTEILHTVKKGDIDAIVEIYNLAQDIYNEIDKTSTDHVLEEAMNTVKTVNFQNIKSDTLKKVTKHDHVSYWYEPLASDKGLPNYMRPDMSGAETIRNDVNPMIPVLPIDMKATPANVDSKPTINTVLAPSPAFLPTTQVLRTSDTFYNSPRSFKDFGKTPYYYPMSNFLRTSSYTNELKKTRTSSIGTQAPKSTITYKPLFTGGKYQKDLKPSIFLPYPFTNIHHDNWCSSQDLNRRHHLFDNLGARRHNNRNTMKKHITKQDNVVLMNPDLENFQDLQIRASMKEENIVNTHQKQEEVRRGAERRKPDWQTDSLPEQILDEVRAHIQEKQKLFIHPFPLRKKVKLERVGKVLKMDEITRTKRSVDKKNVANRDLPESEIYEVYIERTTCNADYKVPGYFRYGNLSQPFPECCPQRIPTP